MFKAYKQCVTKPKVTTSSDLYRILNTHFGKSMNLARIKVMSMMICALCKVQQVAYTELAAAFDNEVAASSLLLENPAVHCQMRD